ncbi:DUF6844 domain-containing protein [Chromohalobacter sarecensis]|uniref:DUF6844 domain-containing protein n=1 Tax=Chromohalobacter sarecensis TaxID=245294 RepID=A0ABV9CY35_9GAMM|nr:hypothetical protein [Chromohalobacter sarecensis]MCK0715657.1 hypothetical protein [Chromohalobacter sarecensis]
MSMLLSKSLHTSLSKSSYKPLVAAVGLACLALSPMNALAQSGESSADTAASSTDAPEAPTQETAASTEPATTQPSDAPPPFLAVDEVSNSEELIQRFLEKRGWQQGPHASNPAGGNMVVATESIPADPSTIEFSQARLIATEEAFLKAMGELVSQDAVNVGKTMADRFMKDGLPEEVKDTTGLGALGEAVASRLAESSVQALNKVIEELGGDPSQLPQLNIAERKQLLYDEFVTSTTWQAMGQLSGVGVFGLVEETGGDGPVNNGSVSIVVVQSPRFSELGRQLRNGSGAPARALPVSSVMEDLRPMLDEGTPMLGMFGVQPVVEEGRFGLMSFGMSAPALVRGSMEEYEINAEMEAARQSAKLMADGWLAQFATMTVQGQKETSKRKLREQVRETRGDGTSRILTQEGIGRMVRNVMRSESQANLKGVQTIGQWNATDPVTGHPYLGYVKYWSPGTAANAEARMEALANPDEGGAASTSSGASDSQATPESSRSTGSFGEW